MQSCMPGSAGLRLVGAYGSQPSEMTASVKSSRQPCTKSCGVAGNVEHLIRQVDRLFSPITVLRPYSYYFDAIIAERLSRLTPQGREPRPAAPLPPATASREFPDTAP